MDRRRRLDTGRPKVAGTAVLKFQIPKCEFRMSTGGAHCEHIYIRGNQISPDFDAQRFRTKLPCKSLARSARTSFKFRSANSE